MANYCFNSLDISGSIENIKRLKKFISIKGGWSLHKIIPVKEDESYREKWGTKWIADIDFQDRGGSATISFDSAWSPLLPVTLEMSRMFNLKIHHYYEECGCDFEGDFVVDNGEVTLDDEREYRPMCEECGEKKDRKDMVDDEDGYEDKCLDCADELRKLIKEKIKK